MTRRQALKAMLGAAAAAVAPIPAMGAAENVPPFDVTTLDPSGLVGKTFHVPCACCDPPTPTEWTITFMGTEWRCDGEGTITVVT